MSLEVIIQIVLAVYIADLSFRALIFLGDIRYRDAQRKAEKDFEKVNIGYDVEAPTPCVPPECRAARKK